MRIIQEFKEFAIKGNALDLAVGVIIGAAFGKIVSSLVEDIIMPPLGFIIGKIDFSNLFLALDRKSYDSLKAAQDAGAPIISYGVFLNNIVNFLIVAFAIFLIIKQINQLKRGEEVAPEAKECPFCKQSVAIDASRCSHCTSQLDTVTAA